MLNENKCHGFSSAVLIVKGRKQTNPDVHVEHQLAGGVRERDLRGKPSKGSKL